MRYLYTIFLYLATPFILMGLVRRAFRDKAYLQRVPERFAHIPPITNPNTIWLHAVSLGESIAATPFITALLTAYPNHTLVVTTMTPTGSRYLMKTFGTQIFHVYAPYDLPHVIRRFLSRIHPQYALIMETELWPHILYYLKKSKINTLVVNARLSTRSFQRYYRMRHFLKPFLDGLRIAAQSQRDADYFAALDIPKSHIFTTGNIKFDQTPSSNILQAGQTLRQTWGLHRPTFIAASTHEGEEKILLEAFRSILEHNPHTLFILVPRHPNRFASVRQLCMTFGYNCCCRSEGKRPTADTHIYMGDTMGELLSLYAASDIAFVGGSLIPRGGHNLIEPASVRLPILSGPYLDNFVAIRDTLLEANALLIVDNAATLAKRVIELIDNAESRHAYGNRALQVSEANRGALAKTMQLISELISQTPA